MRMVAIFLFLIWPAFAFAQDAALLKREAVLETSFRKNAGKFSLPVSLVKAIARQESGCSPLMVNIRGKDFRPKSVEEAVRLCNAAKERGLQYDAGIMQINRYWIEKYNIPHRLLFMPSENIYLGCFILSQEIKRGGMNWQSIGKYHSRTPKRRDGYAKKIQRHLADILAEKR